MSADVDLCIANLEIKLAVIEEASKKVLDEHCNKVFLISTLNYCPVDKGNLQRSAKNVVFINTLTEYARRISYGDDSVNYSIFVHEMLNKRHSNPPTACAKFLERAVTETNNELFESMQAVV